MADNIYKTLKDRAITVLDGLSGLNTVKNYAAFIQGDSFGGYPASHVSMRIDESGPVYFHNGVADDHENEATLTIETIINSVDRDQVSDDINTWRVAIENAIISDATLENIAIDLYKSDENEIIFPDNDKFGLLEQNFFVRYQYKHGGA